MTTNSDRAGWAFDALGVFIETKDASKALENFREEVMPNEDDHTTMKDLVCDLHHHADNADVLWAAVMRSAQSGDDEETCLIRDFIIALRTLAPTLHDVDWEGVIGGADMHYEAEELCPTCGSNEDDLGDWLMEHGTCPDCGREA